MAVGYPETKRDDIRLAGRAQSLVVLWLILVSIALPTAGGDAGTMASVEAHVATAVTQQTSIDSRHAARNHRSPSRRSLEY
jgi:hypothetical protein